MLCLCGLVYIPLILLSCGIAGLVISYYYLKNYFLKRIRKRHAQSNKLNIAFFHPYCNAGGGGERVLWCAIRTLLNNAKASVNNALDIKIIIYTGDPEEAVTEILQKVKNTFNISIDKKHIQFVFLKRRQWVEPEKYPYFTLLGQSLGSIYLGFEALFKYTPDIFIDTMGYAFTLPIFRFIGHCKVACYIHYPTISTDMLKRVQSRVYAHNNRSYVVRNPFVTYIKLVYYRLFAKLYSSVGRSADTIMVNSTWTENHINSLWNVPFKTHRIYPPCDVKQLKSLTKKENKNEKINILSIGQFRPEKDHPLQLQALYELRTILNDNEQLWNKLCLIIVGSCRNNDDIERMNNIKDLSKHLSLENNVEFYINVSHQKLIELFEKSTIGIHTMWNEHFGIGVVELMAAGLITIAHRSGGPLMDIIETSEGSQTGYLAVDAIEYAKCIATVLYNTEDQNNTIQDAARSSVNRFSESEFDKGFLYAIEPLLEKYSTP